MKKLGWLLTALGLALLLSACAKAPADYNAQVQQGVAYLQSLEGKDPGEVTQVLRERELARLQAERAAREQAVYDDLEHVWQYFSDAAILGDSRAVGFSYYSFLDESRVLASSGERVSAVGDHVETLKKLDPATIYLCYGINDIGWYASAQEYADAVQAAAELLQKELPDANIVVSSILPAQEIACQKQKLWRQIPDYSAAVGQMCAENGILFADNTALCDEHGDLWQADGIHLFPQFYPYWAANLLIASWGEAADA